MKKILTILILILITSLNSYADVVTKTKLPSGQKVIVKEIHTNPIVMIDTWVKTGSVDENDCNNGVAHFLEHLFFKGSENYPNNEFDKILESKGAVTNAATSKDFTHFHILIPSKDFETAVKLHADMLSRPLLPQNEIDKERNVVIREIERSNDNPSRILYNKFNKALYPTHPYKREILGTKEIISTIPREEIFSFYSKNYAPENLITVIAGDVNSKDAVNYVSRCFSNPYTAKRVSKKIHKQDKKPSEQIRINTKEDVNTSSLIIGYKCGLKVTDKDSFALDLLAEILGQGRSSRFYKEIKDKKQLAQAVTANNVSMKEDSVFTVSASLNENNIPAVENEIFQEIEKIKKYGITEEELNRAKKMTERATLYARESVEDNTSEIGYSTLITDDWNFYDNYLSKMKKITTQDVQKATQKYLNSQNAVIASLTPVNPKPEIQKQITSEQSSCSDKIVTNQYFKAKKHAPVKIEKHKNLVKYTLNNGAVLITDKHQNNEIIAIDIKIKGGNYLIKNHGLPQITSSVILKGTKKYPKNSFAEITEENGIKISSEGDKEYFTVRMKCTKPDLPLALDMLHQVLNEAVLTEEDIEKTKQSLLHSIKQNRDNASNVVFEEISYELWKNTPYDTTGITIEKELPNISKEQITNYYNNLFDSKNAIISINGNIDEKEMINYFSEVIQPKNNKVVNYADYKKDFLPITENQEINKEQGKEAAWLVMGWKTDGITNQKDKNALSVLNAILGSGMSSRLFSEVRAEKGLAYAIGSTHSVFVNQGVFLVYIGTEPSKLNEAEKAMLAEIEKFKKEFVTDKELEDAKNKIKGEKILTMESNSAKAHFVSVSEQNGNGYDYYFDKFNKGIDDVTVTDIINVANKYFSEHYVVSKVFPKK